MATCPLRSPPGTRSPPSRDPAGLADLLADEVVFRSPAVHTPQAGKQLTTAYLSAAVVVLGPTLDYKRQWYADTNAVLEFEAELDGLTVHGIDMLQWNDEGRLVEFTVMVRPVQGAQQADRADGRGAVLLTRESFVGWPTKLSVGRQNFVVQARDSSAGRRNSPARTPQKSNVTPACSTLLSHSFAASASSWAQRDSFAGPTGPRHSPSHVLPV